MSEINNQNTNPNENVEKTADDNVQIKYVKSTHSGSSQTVHHHHHHHHHRRKKTVRNIITIVLLVLLAGIVVTIISGVMFSNNDNTSTKSNNTSSSTKANESLKTFYVGSSKDPSGNYDYASVTDAINAWRSNSKASNAIIVRNSVSYEKIYRVGSGRTFTTIKEAVAQWNNDGQPSATILVDCGTYITTSNPSDSQDPLIILPKNTNQLNIIGEDKDGTIVKATTGKYIHPAIMVKGGNVTIKNITFLSDHSTNPSFTYREKDGYNSAYAVHCDGGNISGVIEFDNCNMWSWQSCGIGTGTIFNSHVIIKNCDIRSFTEGYAVDPNKQFANDAEEEEHAKFVHGSRGAIVYHPSSHKDGVSNETFTLINSYVYAKNAANTMRIQYAINDTNKNDFKMVTFINNVFSNDFEFCNSFKIPDGIYLGNTSTGNNLSFLNNTKGAYSLTIEN